MKLRGSLIFVALSVVLGVTASLTSFKAMIVVTCLFYCLWLWKKGNKIVLALSVLLFSIACMITYFHEESNQTKLPEETSSIIGTIHTIPHFNGDQLSFIMKTSKEKVLVYYHFPSIEKRKFFKEKLVIGMACNLRVKLEQPSPVRNFEAFNYKKYLARKGIYWIATVEEFEIMQCKQLKTDFYYFLQKWRQKGIQYVEDHFPKTSYGLVQALLFGERTGITEETTQNYQKLGIIHLLAISGLHVGLLWTSFFFIGIRIGITRETVYNCLILLLPLYIFIAGAAPSVIRACIMTMMVILSIRSHNRISPLDGLSIACVLMLLHNPHYLIEIGFQLSFIVSFFLVLSSTFIISSFNSYLSKLFTVTLIAQLSSFPLILYYSYEISLISIPVNMIFVPFIAILMLPLTFISVFVNLIIPDIGIYFIDVLDLLFRLAQKLVNILAKQDLFTISVQKPHEYMLVLYYIAIISFFIQWEKNIGCIRRVIKPLLGILLVFLLHSFIPYLNPYGNIFFLDVGQGDSLLIELPFRRAVYMIDTGGTISFSSKEKWQERQGNFEIGEDVVVPFLKARGIKKIDKLILTHADFDHMGAAPTILQKIKIKELIIGEGPIESEFEKEVYKLAYKKGAYIHKVKKGDMWESDGYKFYVLSPLGDEESKNERSIVVATNLGGKNFLLTGDLEEQGEKNIINHYPSLNIDVLKVGHHGSRTSTTKAFVSHITPEVSIISVGRKNRFGHPDPTVLTTLKTQNVKVLRTDQHGAIRYRFYKNNGTFESVLP